MPAPNELTPEEEAQFGQHGVAPAGPGSEPVIEGGEQQQQPVVEEPLQPAAVEEPQPATIEVSRHRTDGTFKTQAEFEADMEAARVAAEQGGAPAPAPAAQPQPQMVPHQALHEARQREAKAREMAQLATTRLNAILAAQQGRGPQPEAMPNLNEDPAGYIQALEQRLSAFEQERQQETEFRQIDQAIHNDEELFKQSVPDYEQASDHYVQSRATELLAFYPPQQAQQIMMNEARQIANQAWQRGQSLGQVIYQLAQARGYQPGNTAADPTKAPIPPRPTTAVVPIVPTAQQRVDQINNGQAQSRSLGGSGGGAPTKALNAEALLAMSDEDFAEYLKLGTKSANTNFQNVG